MKRNDPNNQFPKGLLNHEGHEGHEAFQMSNRRTGKIARLPKEVRDVVNLMLRDGASYPAVIEYLRDHGHGEFNAENVSNWFEGGFCDWERDQQRIADIRARSQAALEMVRELKKDGDIHITEANELMLASQVNEVLQEINTEDIKALIQLEPKNYPKFAKIVTAQSNERTKRQKLELEYQRYRDRVEAQKRAIESELAKAKDGGLAPETISKIEEALNLL